MSRILRRPMFRGGRVDSRGTGITSGLSYQKGGRVGYYTDQPGGVVLGKDLIANNIFSGTPKSKDYIKDQEFYKNYKIRSEEDLIKDYKDMMRQKEDDLTMTFGIDDFSGYGKSVAEDLDYYRDPEGGMKKFFQEEKAKDDAARIAAAKVNVTLPELINSQLNNNKSTITGKGTGGNETVDRKKIMEENKELFAELLGGNKARGEDISNMLLSFAGKALKPEATVKGAFGEFFEEEAKRPSSKTKVDQAAAQLAINQYIKGEISRAELNKLIAMNSMKTNLGDRFYIADSLKTANTFSAGVKDGIQKNPQRRGEAIRFQDVLSKDMLPPEQGGNFKPGPEDVGIIFIETDTKKAYEFDINGNQIPIYTR